MAIDESPLYVEASLRKCHAFYLFSVFILKPSLNSIRKHGIRQGSNGSDLHVILLSRMRKKIWSSMYLWTMSEFLRFFFKKPLRKKYFASQNQHLNCKIANSELVCTCYCGYSVHILQRIVMKLYSLATLVLAQLYPCFPAHS